MPTYKQLQEYVKTKHGVSVKTCHIAHVKHMNGFEMRKAPNRKSEDKRVYECPKAFIPIIEDAMRHFGLLKANS